MEKKRLFTVTLVRHGETMHNRDKIMQGQLDTQLSDLGEEQARLVGRRLNDQRFTHAFSSDLSRASNTARKILQENLGTACELTLDRRLRERSFGYLEGRPFTDFKQAQQASGLSQEMFTPEGGETVEQVYHRAKDFFQDLCRLMAEPLKDEAGLNDKDQESSHFSSVTGSQSSLTKKVHSGALTDASNFIDLSPTCSSDSSSFGTQSQSSPFTTKFVNGQDLKEVTDHVLIVSHGLLLRELKRVILEKFHGVLEDAMATEAPVVSPNTGVTSLTLSVNYKYGKVKVTCVECHVINCTAHLCNGKKDLISHALFKGAL
ncbi:hypothetical protein EGW08_008351 [Elysia chlorotica]|uniref:Fructose-2,6-bisphosphatase TIGAR n=1 Tax=Elysia chlorotica TaxID=188477 RepID=A0A3S1BLV1_ELYCH|nr:hypothetical protein EGW08_008351 [Elysia chlorotica]